MSEHSQHLHNPHAQQVGPPEHGGPGKAKRPTLRKRYAFTYNNPSVECIPRLKSTFSNIASLVIWQREIGELGTPHLQGYVEFKTKYRIRTLRTLLLLDNTIHWEAAKGTRDENVIYCSKPGGTSPYRMGFPDAIRVISDLRPWQQWLVTMINEEHAKTDSFDDRSIYWIWDTVGNVGKTALAKYLCVNTSFNAIYVSGKGSDVKFALKTHFDTEETNKDKLVVLWNLSRAQERFGPYSTLEAIKDGLAFSGKYESSSLIFNSPIVIVFANWYPQYDSLSVDRWKIKQIPMDF